MCVDGILGAFCVKKSCVSNGILAFCVMKQRHSHVCCCVVCVYIYICWASFSSSSFSHQFFPTGRTSSISTFHFPNIQKLLQSCDCWRFQTAATTTSSKLSHSVHQIVAFRGDMAESSATYLFEGLFPSLSRYLSGKSRYVSKLDILNFCRQMLIFNQGHEAGCPTHFRRGLHQAPERGRYR